MFKLVKTLSLWTLLLISFLVQAQTKKYEWKTAMDGDYSYTYVTEDPNQTRFYKLKNGMTVILSVDKKVPRIQSYIAVKAGSKHDPKNNTGLAHYLEHLMFKGTDKYGSLDWSKESPLLARIDSLYEIYNHTTDDIRRKAIYSQIDQVSGEAANYAIPNEYDKLMNNMGAEDVNAGTFYDQTAYQENIPNNIVDKYFMVQAERFRNPVFRLFHTELETVYEEKNMYLEEEFWKTLEQVLAALLPNHNYGKQTIIGSAAHLKNPSLKRIREFYNTYYVPNNMAVVMCGDFDPADIVRKIDRSFAFMKAKEVPNYVYDKEQAIEKPIIKEVFGPQSESLTLGFRFPGAASKDAQLLQVVSKMLTNGTAGLIDLNLVSGQKLLEASAYPLILKDYSLLLLTGQPSQGQSLDHVRELLLMELKKLRKGEFSEELIQAIINNERKDNIKKNESYGDKAEELSTAFVQEVDWAKIVSHTDWLMQITKNDIVEFANKYLTDRNYVVVYKRQGIDSTTVKMDKPAITPIHINRDDQSVFAKTVHEMPESVISPLWIDYGKEVGKADFDGWDVRAVENKANNLFTLSYRFPLGKWDSKLLPLALDYFSFIGTKKKSNERFKQDFYKIACQYGTSITAQECFLSIAGLEDNFDESVVLLQDLLRNCTGDTEAFDAFMAGVMQSRANAKEDKTVIRQGLAAYATYGAKNPFNNVLKDSELELVKEEDLIKILHTLADAKHTVLYYGPRTITALLNKLPQLKRQPGAYHVPLQGTQFKAVPTDSTTVLFADYKMAQVDVLWTRTSEPYNSKEVGVASLFNSYFGEGMNSVVFQTIRESQGLAYATAAVFAQPDKKERNGTVFAYVGTQPDKFNEAIASMNQLLDTLPASQLSFKAAKNSLTKSLSNNRITNENILWSYLSNEKLGHQSDMRKKHFEEIGQLDFVALNDFHKKEFSKKDYVYCIVGDQGVAEYERCEEIG